MQTARINDVSNISRAKRAAFALMAVVATAALLTGCGNRADSAAPLTASAIAITAPDGAIPVTTTMQFVATVTDADGNTLTATPTWTVVNGGGTITSGGLFTAGDSAGTFVNTVVATIGSVTASSTVTVGGGALFSITVTPETVTVAVGATQHFVAVGRDAHGNVVTIPNRVWSASGGTIDTSGTFTAALTPGSGTVHVMSGVICVNASVVITHGPISTISVHPSTVTLPKGWTQQFTTFGHDSYGNVFAIPNRVWSVAALGGTIDTAGLFTAGTTSGTFTGTVTSTVGSISGTGTVTVSPGALSSITVTPSPASIAVGATQQFTAVGHDVDGNVVAISPTWAAASSGTISNTGLYTADTVAGSFANAVSATVGVCNSAITGRASVTIVAGALATITVSPTIPNVVEGATQQFSAVGTDAHGNVVAITPTWDVTSVGGGTINSSTGLYTAGLVFGRYMNSVRATASSISGTASVNVSAPSAPLASIVITPANPSMFGPGTKQFTATGYDASMNVVPIPGNLVWSLNTQEKIGSIDNTGLYTYDGVFNGTLVDVIHVSGQTAQASTSLTLDCGC